MHLKSMPEIKHWNQPRSAPCLCRTFREHFAVIVCQRKPVTSACVSKLGAKIPHTHARESTTDAGGHQKTLRRPVGVAGVIFKPRLWSRICKLSVWARVCFWQGTRTVMEIRERRRCDRTFSCSQPFYRCLMINRNSLMRRQGAWISF